MSPGGGAEAAAAEGGGGPRQRHLHRHGGAPGPAHQVTIIQGVYTTLLRHPVSDSGGGEAEVEAASEEFSLHADRLGEAASLACSMSGSEEGDTANILLG